MKRITTTVIAAAVAVFVGAVVMLLLGRPAPQGTVDSMPEGGLKEEVPSTSTLSAHANTSAIPTRQSPPIRRTLPPGMFVEVLAQTEQRVAVAGATVDVYTVSPSGRVKIAEGLTDSDGLCRLEALDATFGTGYLALVHVGRLVSDLSRLATDSRTTITLREGKIVALSVKGDASAFPATVIVRRIGAEDTGPLETLLVDSEAPVQLRPVLVPAISIRAIGADGSGGMVSVTFDTSSVTQSTVVLLEHRVAAVVVETEQSRSPISSVDLFVDGVRVSSHPTDAKGRTDALVPSDYLTAEVGIRADGIPIAIARSALRSDDGLYHFVFEEGVSRVQRTTIIVSDGAGHPVASAIVGFDGMVGAVSARQATADGSGRLIGVTFGDARRERAVVYADSFEPAVFEYSASVSRVELKRTQPVNVRIRTSSGLPVAHAFVRLSLSDGGRTFIIALLADQSGALTVYGAPGWQVAARRQEGGAFSAEASLDGAVARGIELTVPDTATGEVTVRLVPFGESPIPSTLDIEAHNSDGADLSVRLVGQDLTLRGLLTPTIALAITAPTKGVLLQYDGPLSSGSELRLLEPARVTLILVGASISDGVVATVGAESLQPPISRVYRGAVKDSRIVVDLPSGRWNVELLAEDWVGSATGVEVAGGSPTSVAVTMRHPAAVELELRPARPTTDAWVQLFRRQGSEAVAGAKDVAPVKRAVEFDAAGHGKISGLVPGVYSIIVLGSASSGRSWIGAVAEVHAAPGDIVRCGVWTQPVRAVELVAPPAVSDGATSLVGLRVEYLDETNWIGQLGITRVYGAKDRSYALLWDGPIAVTGPAGDVQYYGNVRPTDTEVLLRRPSK